MLPSIKVTNDNVRVSYTCAEIKKEASKFNLDIVLTGVANKTKPKSSRKVNKGVSVGF